MMASFTEFVAEPGVDDTGKSGGDVIADVVLDRERWCRRRSDQHDRPNAKSAVYLCKTAELGVRLWKRQEEWDGANVSRINSWVRDWVFWS